MESEEIPTPELAKMAEVRDTSQEIGEFIEWAGTQGMTLCKVLSVGGYPEEQYIPINLSIERLLARYFEIDLVKVEAERRAILEQIRSQS